MQKVSSNLFLIFIRASCKITVSYFLSRYSSLLLCVLYLALEVGSPYFQTNSIRFTYIFIGFSTFVHTNHRISFDFLS